MIHDDSGHTIHFDDPYTVLDFLYTHIEGSGVTPENPFIKGQKNDPAWKRHGVLMQYDQREFVDPDDSWDEANFANYGWLYYPNQCADGSTKCKITFALHGCYGQASSVVSDSWGYVDLAYRNNLIVVAP